MAWAQAGVAPSPGTAEASAAEEAGEVVIVTARAQRLYRVRETAALKLPGEPLTQPASVQIVNAQLIEDQGARDAQDLYRNLSGVSFFSYGGVTARGFRQEEIFFDGLRGDPSAGFSVPQLFNIERVEFLKGPAGMLYGPGAPGGLFNYVTRKPKEAFAADLRVIAGDLDRRGISGSVTGAILGGPLKGRLAGFHESRDLPRDNADNVTTILDGGLSLDVGFGTLTLQHTDYDIDLGGNRLRGVPVDNDGRFLAARTWNHNEATDFLRLKADSTQVSFDGRLGDAWALNAAARFGNSLETQQYHEPNGLIDLDADGVPDATRRQFRDQVRDLTYWSAAANLVWSGKVGDVPLRLLAGVDAFETELVFDGRSLNGTNVPGAGRPDPLSLRAPIYGARPTSTYALPAFTRSLTEGSRLGGYALAEATFGRFIASGGARFDRFEDVSGATRFEDERPTWRAGLVYRAREDLSFYGQWAESFEPQGVGSQDPRAGGPFEPTEGGMIEGGAKAVMAGGRLQSTFSAYRIVRTNILQADPRGDVAGDGVSDLVAFGEVTSQGFEIDLSADLTPDWVLTANYGHNDTRITATNGRTAITNAVGARFANAPLHKFGFWTRWQTRPQAGDWTLALAFGGDLVGERTSLSGQRVKPYSVFDASIIAEMGGWKAMLRVDNLFDETYAASGFIDRTGHFPGEPRSLFVELSRRW
jgi:iron complex outermembrane receptor protein